MDVPLDNHIVRLLSSAAPVESTEPAEAAALYIRAWDEATDDFEACMAAHYVARIQDTAEGRFHWNALAIHHAMKDARASGFLPSLHLNLGRSHEDLGRIAEARASYRAAADALAGLPADAYRASLEAAVRRGLRRAGAPPDRPLTSTPGRT